jgi:hypothetical protein
MMQQHLDPTRPQDIPQRGNGIASPSQYAILCPPPQPPKQKFSLSPGRHKSDLTSLAQSSLHQRASKKKSPMIAAANSAQRTICHHSCHVQNGSVEKNRVEPNSRRN